MGCCSDSSSSSCSSSCSSSGQGCSSTTAAPDLQASQAALLLADLLGSTPEFQEFFKTSQAVNRDPQANLLLRQIRFSQTFYGQPDDPNSTEQLAAKLEAMPVFQAYRAAEQRVKELFCAVDQVISRSAGMPFAANAKASACG
jgi:cell fate (sporulation/competence/biofilm development) regulator YlbF (YheA/YmcA/DUF963 family)